MGDTESSAGSRSAAVPVRRRRRRRASIVSAIGATGILAVLLIFFGARQVIYSQSAGRIFDSVSDLPATRAGLVLGTSPNLPDGRPNQYFLFRIRAASQLFESGKVDVLIVSGGTGPGDYNEPDAMKEALTSRGVPPEKIICDYHGVRTLDSVLRCHLVFGQDRFTVVSQEFHNRRAVFIGVSHGLDVYGLNAGDVTRRGSIPTMLREQLARVMALLDQWVLKTRPKVLGEPVRIP